MADKNHFSILLNGSEEWNAWRQANPDVTPDLSDYEIVGLTIKSADLSHAILSGCKFIHCNLRECEFISTKLDHSTFIDTTAFHCNFNRASMYRANFSGCEMLGATFMNSELIGAKFNKAKLNKSDFSNATLHEASFEGANLREARFIKADLQLASLVNADLRNSRMDEASLCDALVERANFNYSNMQKANFRGVDLRKAGLEGADLRGAKFEDAKLRHEQMAAAIIDPDIHIAGNSEAFSVTVRIGRENLDSIHVATLEGLIQEIERHNDGCHIKIESIVDGQATVRVTSEGPGNAAMIAADLRELRDRYELACRRLKQRDSEIRAIKEKYERLLLKMAKGNSDVETIEATILFFDVAGFSDMDDQQKTLLLNAIWTNAKMILNGGDVYVSNTWGDGLMAAFPDPNDALGCAIQLIGTLRGMRQIARIGVSWGRVNLTYNELKGSLDIIGRSVDVAARLEPLIKSIEDDSISVLSSREVYLLGEVDHKQYQFKRTIVKVAKSFGDFKTGDEVECYSVTCHGNNH